MNGLCLVKWEDVWAKWDAKEEVYWLIHSQSYIGDGQSFMSQGMYLVTPGRITPVLRGGVTNSLEPSGSSRRMKRFIAPTWWACLAWPKFGMILTYIIHLNDGLNRDYLGDFMIFPKEPKALMAPVLLSNLLQIHGFFHCALKPKIHCRYLCPQCGGIVGAHLGEATTSRPGSHVLRVGQQVDWLEPSRVVRSHWAEQHEQPCFTSRSNSEGWFCPNHGRPDVEGGGGVVGHPLLVHHHQPPDTLHQLLPVKSWQAGSRGGQVHPGHVVHRSEQPNFPINTSVGFHALKQLLGIMQDLREEPIQEDLKRKWVPLLLDGRWSWQKVQSWELATPLPPSSRLSTCGLTKQDMSKTF